MDQRNYNGFLNVYQYSRFRGIKNYINYIENQSEDSDESQSQKNTTVIGDDSQIEIIDISP